MRAKTATADWCKPTAELSTTDLAPLLQRARYESTGTAVIVDRPPVPDRPRSADVNRAREPSVVYPTAPASYTWVWPLAIAVGAAVLIVIAIAR